MSSTAKTTTAKTSTAKTPKKLSGMAKAAIVIVCLAVLGAIVVGALFGAKVISIESIKAKFSSATTAATEEDSADAPADEEDAVVEEEEETTAQPTVTPPPANTSTTTPRLTASMFLDRGCWRDSGFQFGAADRWVLNSDFNRAMGLDNVIDLSKVTGLSTDEDFFNYAVTKAIEGNFNTFAFQNGNELRLGKYNETKNGVVFKYDKFGPYTAAYCPYRGGAWINHVFSTIAPNTTTKVASAFKDRGCWQDGDVAGANPFRGIRTVGKSWINMKGTGVPVAEWYNYAVRQAVLGNFDTFAFQAGFALFLGNTNDTFSYYKFGRPAVDVCPEYGAGWMNRVYSTIDPVEE